MMLLNYIFIYYFQFRKRNVFCIKLKTLVANRFELAIENESCAVRDASHRIE